MSKKGKKQAPADPRRDEHGRILPGHTLNPGGVPKEALRLRKVALESAGEALEIAAEMMRSDNPLAQNFGITHILNRALGRDGPASDLPDDETEIPENLDTSPASLHAMATRGLARSLLHLEARAKSRVLSPGEIELQAEAAKALSTLLKEERELEKAGASGKLSDADLRREVLKSVPLEELQAAITERAK